MSDERFRCRILDLEAQLEAAVTQRAKDFATIRRLQAQVKALQSAMAEFIDTKRKELGL